MSAPPREALSREVRAGNVVVEIRTVASESEFLEALDIRRRVFAIEQHVAGLSVSDADDPRSLIALARIQPKHGTGIPPLAVSTGRITPWPSAGGPALIAWVATVPEFRRRHIGHEVMQYLLDAADSAGIPLVNLAAQAPAEPFYRRLGFERAGPNYDVRGIPHLRMARRHSR